jgi:hypothetical protein
MRRVGAIAQIQQLPPDQQDAIAARYPLSKSLLFQFMMTLTELLPAIKQLSPLDKIKLIRLLAEEMESREKIAPLEPGKAYNLPTPYNSFGAGAILMQVIESSDEA